MSDTSENKAILRDFIREVWDRGDAEAAERYLAPVYTIHHDPGDPWDGKVLDLEGYRERVRLSRAPFPDQRFDIQTLIEEGSQMVMTWLWSATHTGDLPGFPATGKRITMSGATIYFFNESHQLTGHWQITDRLGVFQQLRG